MTAAQKSEAKRQPVKVKFKRTQVYEIHPEKITIAAFEALRADNAYDFVLGLLGQDQFDAFKAKNPLLSALRDIADAILVALGNSSASSS